MALILLFSVAGDAGRRQRERMKYWLLTLLVIVACSGTLTWIIQKKVVPGFLSGANGEMVADWHAGLTECRKETGSWPDLSDSTKFGDQVYILVGADGRRIPGGFMHSRPSHYHDGRLYDVYQQPMRVTLDGEKLLIASAGPNGAWGDADDVTSDKVQERYQPSTLAQARKEAEARAKKNP
jgi:hypothetical protein